MWLCELLSCVSYSRVIDFRDACVLDVFCDSRKCTKGCIFIALDGESHACDAFVEEAVKNGACAIVTERLFEGFEKYKNVILSINARKTMAEMAKCLYGSCLDEMILIGVTGTKGKTTTSLCLGHVLNFSGIRTAVIGTLGYIGADGDTAQTNNTTPEAPDLYRMLKKAHGDGATVAVVEVSSQALAKLRVYGIPFTVGIFTNFSEDHVGRSEHATIEEYYLAKRSLFRGFAIETAVLNGHDRMSKHVAEGVARCFFTDCRSLGSECGGTDFLLDGYAYRVFGGEYNAENASLAVITARHVFSLREEAIAKALSSFRAEGRFELYDLRGKRIVIDYAHNGESVRALLSYVRSFTVGRVFAVFGSVGMRSVGRRAALSRACEKHADVSVITSDDPGYESAVEIAEQILFAFADQRRGIVIPDRTDAVIYAVSHACHGDTVVLLGKGHERHQLVNGEKRLFSERALILAMGAKRVL